MFRVCWSVALGAVMQDLDVEHLSSLFVRVFPQSVSRAGPAKRAFPAPVASSSPSSAHRFLGSDYGVYKRVEITSLAEKSVPVTTGRTLFGSDTQAIINLQNGSYK